MKNSAYIFLHFDDIGVPSFEEMIEGFGSEENWQKTMLHQWVEKLLQAYQDKKTIIFEGQVNLKFIQEAFMQHHFSNYQIILLDCDEKTMKKRLLEHRNQPELWNEDMKNWLHYLRNQAQEFKIPILNSSEISAEKLAEIFKNYL